MSKIDERAREYSAKVSGGFILDDRVAAYKSGFQDAMLTPEDIKIIHEIAEDVWKPNCDEQECYQEVLKRFNEIKFK